MRKDLKSNGKSKIMLALQGGGAHSAYVWGVVDSLLKNEDIEIVAVSGTSGGAMVAAALAYGLSCDPSHDGKRMNDRERRAWTRELLQKFWIEVAAIGDYFGNPYRFVPNLLHRSWNIDGMPIPVALNALSLVTSPYQSWSSVRQNPIKLALANCIDFDALNASTRGPALYICATNVRTNQQKIFTKNEVRIDHLLASACLPVVDRAVEIDHEYYWDGGYVSDPALAPLIQGHRTKTNDLVIVGVNPIAVDNSSVPPNTAWEIIDRMNEITFNASLIAEIKRIHEINKLLEQIPANARARQAGGMLYEKEEIFIHYIPPHASMTELGVASKSNTSLPFLEYLKELGHSTAVQWEAGEPDGGGASLLGISSDTNLEDIFIEPHHWKAGILPANYLGPRTDGSGAMRLSVQ